MSTYTTSLGLELITPGSQAGLWGNTTNNTFTLVDQAVTGVTPISFASASGTTYTLTDYNGAVDEARSAVINITGSATGSNTIVVPNKQKTYLVRNNTGQDVVFQTASPTTSYTVGAGYSILIFCDGNNNVFTGIASPGVGTLSVNAGGTGATSFIAGFVKSTGGTNALTSVTAVNATTDLSGSVPVSNGGTGQSSLTSGSLLVGNGTGSVGALSGSSSGQVATWNGSTWTAATPATGGVTSVFGRTGAVTAESGDYSSYYGVKSGANSWTGSNAFYTSGSNTLTVVGTGGGNTLTINGSSITSSGPAVVAASSGSYAFTVSSNATLNVPMSLTFSTSASNSPMLELNGYYPGDTASGAVIKMSNPGAGSTVRTKWIRVDDSGGLNILNSAYSTALMQLSNTGASIWASNLTVASGTGYKSGGGSWDAISDARLKDNVQPLTGALDKIAQLNPVTYSWKCESTEPTVGFIAQEVNKVMPTATSETDATEAQKQFVADDKVMNIGWKNDMTAYLVGAIKELKAELDAAKAEIAALKAAK